MPFESGFACENDGDVAVFLVKNEKFYAQKRRMALIGAQNISVTYTENRWSDLICHMTFKH